MIANFASMSEFDGAIPPLGVLVLMILDYKHQFNLMIASSYDARVDRYAPTSGAFYHSRNLPC